MEEIDIAIIGAGVIGLAVASCVAREGRTVFIFERNSTFGQETSSRNSEVIHAGIYYPEGSLKAKTCVEGKRLLYELCEKADIPYKRIGKVIIAKEHAEIAHLETLLIKGTTNGVEDLQIIDGNELKQIEPHVEGCAALLSPSTGIIDSHRLMQVLLSQAKDHDADIIYRTEVIRVNKQGDRFVVTGKVARDEEYTFNARIVINCAGLHSDIVAESAGINIKEAHYLLHYCKGEYFRVASSKTQLVSHLIYPVPEALSLGIHLIPDLGGGLRIGPNAFYVKRTSEDYSVSDENKGKFLSSAQSLLPVLGEDDIYPDTAGIRPKLQGPGEGIRDFVITHEDEKGLCGLINCIGIESPGLTAALAIGKYVGKMVDDILK